ncbi:MAG: hypothetical protein AB7G39_18900 [Alphaproteobacteria bacterium]
MDPISGIGPLLILAVLLLLFWMVARQRRRAAQALAVPDKGLAYLCNPIPFAKADATLLARFPNLAPAAAAAPPGAAVTLLRCGLFNRTGEAMAAAEIVEPVVFRLPEGATILHAAFAEAIRTDMPDAPIGVAGAQAELPPLALAAGGTLILNILAAGPAEPLTVAGRLADGRGVERLS